MINKLETLLIIVLSVGFITLLGHEMKWWGPDDDLGVVYLQDYNASQRAQHLDEVCEAYDQVLHRVWIDNPSYVEDVLCETDEFIKLNSLITNWEDIFEYQSVEDSMSYEINTERQQIEADLYLKHYREPDSMPMQLKPGE